MLVNAYLCEQLKSLLFGKVWRCHGECGGHDVLQRGDGGSTVLEKGVLEELANVLITGQAPVHWPLPTQVRLLTLSTCDHNLPTSSPYPLWAWKGLLRKGKAASLARNKGRHRLLEGFRIRKQHLVELLQLGSEILQSNPCASESRLRKIFYMGRFHMALPPARRYVDMFRSCSAETT